MNKKDFTIVILNINNSNLYNCIKSIKKQNYNNIEIIIETTKLDKNIIEEINTLDINYIIREQKDLDIPTCYNDALSISTSKYINFIDSNIIYLDNILDEVKKYLSNNIVVTNMKYYDLDINKYKNYKLSSTLNEPINLIKTPTKINTCLSSYFINKELLKDISFNRKTYEDSKSIFISELYKKEKSYYNLGTVSLSSISPFEDTPSKYTIQFEKRFYNESLINWINYCKNSKEIPKYIQEIIMYVIYSKYNCNLNDNNKNIIKDKELDEFLNNTKILLSYIDDEVILRSDNNSIEYSFNMDEYFRKYFYELKNGKITKTYSKDNKLYDSKTNSLITYLSNQKVNVYAINYKDNKLVFDCTTSIGDFIKDNFDIKVVYGNKTYKTKKTNIYNKKNVFGFTLNNKYTFQFEIDLDHYGDLNIYFTYDKKDYKLSFDFIKPQSRLNNSKRAYWNYKDFTIQNKVNKLIINKRKSIQTLKLEILFMISKLKNENRKGITIYMFLLRFLYYLTKPFMKNKHIWITFDKLYKAGDNGEYIYRYGLNNNKNIYYVVKKDAPDYKRLIKENKKHILIFNSLREKLYFLHSEVVLKTHEGILGFFGFKQGIERTLIRDIFNAEVMEIQHGLTIQNIPQYQNRLEDNIKLYFIASKYEEKNISQEEYGYDKEQIKLTGIARYDGLKNNDQRIILITPTWRHNISSPSLEHGKPREHNNIFKKSKYYEIYNSLINDKKLIECAKDNNYKIIYLIHPTLSAQIDDFDKNDYVDIIPAIGNMSYEKILRESSLMVTDYSGVQYDFAYMRKPILYFQPDELPPHYDSSLDYEKEGFGPIIKTSSKLVEELCNKMKDNCRNDNKYIERANNFFAFDDYNSSKRIIEEVDKYLNK